MINDDAARCAFSEFSGYETSQDVAARQTEVGIKAILGNPVMINAYKEGHSRQWQAFSRRLHDCKDRVVQKKERCVALFCGRADTLKSVRSWRWIPRDFRTRVDADMPSFYVTQRLIRSTFRERELIPEENLLAVLYLCNGKGLYFHGLPSKVNDSSSECFSTMAENS